MIRADSWCQNWKKKKKKKKFISTLGSFLKLSYYQFWKNFPIKDDFVDLSMDRHQSDFIGIHGFKEVQYNSSEHHSVQLFIVAISSHSHIRQEQPQETFLQYSCFITTINIVKKYIWKKIHELNTLIGSSKLNAAE